jgi:chromatin remodeling complex protein RSC6
MSDNNEVNFNKEITDAFTTINNSLTLFKMQFNTLQQQVRTLEKNVKKELKAVKKSAKVTIPKAKKAPSGFAKPTKVTKELCEFMDKPEGTEIARTEVTKVLVNYIKSNNLQEQTADSKNKIVPDDKLKNLLGLNLEETNELTFFNIQKYMNKHFISKKNETTLSA